MHFGGARVLALCDAGSDRLGPPAKRATQAEETQLSAQPIHFAPLFFIAVDEGGQLARSP